MNDLESLKDMYETGLKELHERIDYKAEEIVTNLVISLPFVIDYINFGNGGYYVAGDDIVFKPDDYEEDDEPIIVRLTNLIEDYDFDYLQPYMKTLTYGTYQDIKMLSEILDWWVDTTSGKNLDFCVGEDY